MCEPAIFSFRIAPELEKKARRLAAVDNRSLTNWIVSLIAAEVRQDDIRKSAESKGLR